MAKTVLASAVLLLVASDAAQAGEPVAIVEEVAGTVKGVAVFDYLDQG